MTTIKDHVVIMQESYNLRDWQNAVIQRCIDDNPSLDIVYIAKLLGIASRTLHRRANQGKIRLSQSDRSRIVIAKDEEQIPKFK